MKHADFKTKFDPDFKGGKWLVMFKEYGWTWKEAVPIRVCDSKEEAEQAAKLYSGVQAIKF